jgi:hypothetical protein
MKIKKTLSIIKTILAIIGALFLGAFALSTYAAISAITARTKTDTAGKPDVRFVLNWCRLGAERTEEVVKSHISHRSFTGDHLDAYAIKLTHLSAAELEAASDHLSRWHRADGILPQILSDAVDFATSARHEIPWFPSKEKLLTSDFHIFPWSIRCHGITPSGVKLIFANPSEKMLYYISLET